LEKLEMCPMVCVCVCKSQAKPCNGVGEDPVTYPGKITAK